MRSLSIFDHNTDVKWFQIKHYHSRENPDLVYARFRRYLSSSSVTLEFATNMSNSLAMLIHNSQVKAFKKKEKIDYRMTIEFCG